MLSIHLIFILPSILFLWTG